MQYRDFALVFHGLILLIVHGSWASHQRRGLGAGVSQVADFDCPEEFGYYPHPTDCTQYYVCVFGGALLESCTGGLMYSHELQTCDWPRNVGCGENRNSDSGTVSTIRVTDPRTGAPQHSGRTANAPQQQQNTPAPQTSRSSHRQDYIRHRQPEVIQQQLYTEEDLGPAEEIESDRQQRVYRGQPSTIGQVQRDRDGLRPIKNGVHSQNVIPSGPEAQEKISVVSYGNQRTSAPRPQEQYRDNATFEEGLDDASDKYRWKRQVPYRIGSYQSPKAAKIPIILIPGSVIPEEAKAVRYVGPFVKPDVRLNVQDGDKYGYYGPALLYRPVIKIAEESNKTNDEPMKLAKLTGFLYTTTAPRRYVESSGISPGLQPGRQIVVANLYYYPNVTKGFRYEETTERVVAITSRTKPTERIVAITSRAKPTGAPIVVFATKSGPSNHRAITTEVSPLPMTPTTRNIYRSRFSADATTERVVYKFIETPKNYKYKPTERNPDYSGYDSYEYYNGDYYDQAKKPDNTSDPDGSYEYDYDKKDYDYEKKEYDYEKKEYDYDEEVPYDKGNLTRGFFNENSEDLYTRYRATTTPAPKFFGPTDRVNMKTILAISQGLKRPVRYRSTTARPTTNQIEPTQRKVPEEYYENFRPFPTQSLSPTTVDDRRKPAVVRHPTRVEPVQNYQVTSSLPPLTPTQRTIERYNTSQRYQPNQYDQYYTVYDDDADLYRGNDYVQQVYHAPSSTPSSNIAHQYRGQTTYKQQQAIELEQTRETIAPQHQQPLRNSYSQDVYSPSPVVQDYNDEYNSQIDDSQYQHLVASTPKPSNRSVSTNSSKDTFPQSTVTVSRKPDNTTTKPETVNRRVDPGSYFEPSEILIPPPRVGQGFQRQSQSTPKYSYTTEAYRTITPSTQRSAEPPRNGGALAKTLNNFDSLLTSFFSAVSGKQSSEAKAAPETIVRSEIGRIHHDPIIITDNYRSTFKPVTSPVTTTPAPTKNDYLTYFVEIEPKKGKLPEPQVADPKIVTKEDRNGQSDTVSFNLRGRNRPYSTFVRLVPNGEEHQNVRLTASLDIEPILKPTTPEPETRRESYQSTPPQVQIVKEPETRRELYQNPPQVQLVKEPETRREPYQSPPQVQEVKEPETRREPYQSTPQVQVVKEPETRREPYQNGPQVLIIQEQTTEKPRIRGNTFFRPRLIENASPYKFVVVDAERTTEKQISSPAPFIRNPENEDRNRFDVRNRFRFRSYNQVPKSEAVTESNAVKTDEEDSSESELEEEVSEEYNQTSSVAPEVEATTRKPFRIRVTPESETEDNKKSSRKVVKIHRSELRNQRLNLQKYKRIRKPSTEVPETSPEDSIFNRENDIQSTYRPIVVLDSLSINKALTGGNASGYSAEEPKEISEITRSRLGLYPSRNATGVSDTVPRGFEKPKSHSVELKPIVVPNKEPSSSEKPLFLITSKPQTNRNVTVHENRATTTKPYVRGKFKPSENSKIRFRPTTATPDSDTTPGPHLSTRQPSYSIGNTGNEVTVNRGTPPSTNRGTRPTLKPSTAIVSKASEFIDIYRYPPRRPQNLYATPTPDKSAAKCRKDVCLLPDCSCGGKDIPGGYNAEEIPQLVLLTFDDSVNDLNKGLYSDLFERGRVNPNGCPISATFYVSHEWTDYSQVQNLYANGHEIASHSITHSFGEQFSQKKWTKEIAGQREILAAYGGVRLEDIRGMRAPFLAVGGNKMFKMLYDSNFTYDSSMPIYENRPPSWPYTLDYKLFHDCMIPPCPTKSYPGVWEVPMVMWQDLNGGRCSMGDACSNPPTADGVYKMLIKNFERHFTTNRAPFGLYYHAAWFTHEHHKEGFIAFLDTIVNMPEVWLVTSWQAIQWVRDPQPLSTVENFPPFQCNIEKAKKCNNPKVCNLWHKSGVRYMRTCQPCPDVYPWTGKTGVKNSRVDNEIIEE